MKTIEQRARACLREIRDLDAYAEDPERVRMRGARTENEKRRDHEDSIERAIRLAITAERRAVKRGARREVQRG